MLWDSLDSQNIKQLRALETTSQAKYVQSPDFEETLNKARKTANTVFVRGRKWAMPRKNSKECLFFCRGYFSALHSPIKSTWLALSSICTIASLRKLLHIIPYLLQCNRFHLGSLNELCQVFNGKSLQVWRLHLSCIYVCMSLRKYFVFCVSSPKKWQR